MDKGENTLDFEMKGMDQNRLPTQDCTTLAATKDTAIQIQSCDQMEQNNGKENTQDVPCREHNAEKNGRLRQNAAKNQYTVTRDPKFTKADTLPPMYYKTYPNQKPGPGDDVVDSATVTRERVFEAASEGDKTKLNGLRINEMRLTSPEFTDEEHGETALMNALLHLKDGKNNTIEEILDIAEQTGDLRTLINTSYNNSDYNGQTALHIAIERRSFDHVKLLVQKGADVREKFWKFFQDNGETGFYFGELPLSLAACTNQPDIVSFLIDNEYRSADLTDQDSQGNTVLHALVVIADNTTENTDMFASMYDSILIQHNKLEKKRNVQLEAIENNQGLTPLKLAATLGKIGLLKHMLKQEFKDKDMEKLSRKLTEWHYGPVQSSLYDMSSIDTNEPNSVLKIIVYGRDIPNRPQMLQIEPLRSILQDKWDRFAFKLFWTKFFVYVLYLSIFTAVAFYRKEEKPPFPIEGPLDILRCVGEVISVLGAVWFLFQDTTQLITVFKRNFPNLKALYPVGFYEGPFKLQALLLLICAVLYFCGQREYVAFMVLSLALAWINLLYYSRGSKRLGIYSVMIQRMILGDLLNFLFVYSILLFGFSFAVVALMKQSPSAHNNDTLAEGGSFAVEQSEDKEKSFDSFSFTLLEMFKFTIGMGNLEFTDQVHYQEVFYILLIFYTVLTYILLFNMLIALMGNTVERITQESERIWNLKRAFTILDLERTLPLYLKSKLYEEVSGLKKRGDRRFIRVKENNWRRFKKDAGVIEEEEP